MSYSIGGSVGISAKQLGVTLAFLALACAGIALTQFGEDAHAETSRALNCKWITVNGHLCKVHNGGAFNNLTKCHIAGASDHFTCQ
jgi:hypothetical protein